MRSLLALALATAACGGGGRGDADAELGRDAPADGFDRRALLAHLALHVELPAYAQLAGDADRLVDAVAAHCAAFDGGGDLAATRTAAQDAWRAAIDTWERADAVLVGPAAMDHRALRDRIYAWPLLSTCNLDRDTASRWASPASYDVATRLDNARSLAAIEYLLFETATAHTCFAEPAGWSALGANLPRARCQLAAAIAADVAAQAHRVHDAWRPDAGNYVRELAEAGTSASSIGSAQEAINQISDGLFYVDRMVKDMKLAEAAGIAANSCGTVGEPCDAEVEHRRADHGRAAILVNLRALREAFTGTTTDADGPGFDDYLRGVGADAVADRMTAELDAAIAAAEALPASYRQALHEQRPLVVAAHTAIKAFTDDLKSQFLTVLGLDIPDDVAADND